MAINNRISEKGDGVTKMFRIIDLMKMQKLKNRVKQLKKENRQQSKYSANILYI